MTETPGRGERPTQGTAETPQPTVIGWRGTEAMYDAVELAGLIRRNP